MIEEEKNKLLEEATKAVSEQNRHLGIIIENICDQFSYLVEVYDALDKKIDRFQEETRGTFKMFFDWFSAHDDEKADKKDVGALERRVTRLEEKTI